MSEKKYKIEIVASFVEVCYFGGFDYDEVFEFASFITGVKIDSLNINEYRKLIMQELNKQYPELNRNIYLKNGNILSKNLLETYTLVYKKKYGDYITIKGYNNIKNDDIKVLKRKYK